MAGLDPTTNGRTIAATPPTPPPPPPQQVKVGGQTFTVGANGDAPKFDQFQGKGGAYDAAWNTVAQRLNTQDNGRVSAQLEWEYRMNQAPADQTATWLTQNRTGVVASDSTTPVEYVDTAKTANDLATLKATDPARAQAIDTALSTKLSLSDYGHLHDDLRTAQGWPAQADAKLWSDAATPGSIDRNAVGGQADQILRDATSGSFFSWLGGTKDSLSTTELAYGVQKLAETNPAQAVAVRAELTQRLSAQDAGDFNRVLAGQSNFGEGLGTAVSHPVDGVVGAAKGFAGFFVDAADLLTRGSMMQAAGEQRQNAGMMSLLGNDKRSDAMNQLADGIDQAARQRQLPVIEPSNIAQKGGADAETVGEIGLGAAGVVRGGMKLGAKVAVEDLEAGGTKALGSAGEVAGQAVKRSDPALISQHPLLTSHSQAHAVARHGGAVTDEQLITRARTGRAPDGSQMNVPPKFSSAFHSDALLVEADEAIRAGPLQVAIKANPNATNITLKADQVGDLGKNLGRAYERIGKSTDLQGPLREVTDLRSAQASYELNRATGAWETITLFPVKAP